MNTIKMVKISAALLTFMTLAQCIDGDQTVFDDPVESATGYPTYTDEGFAPDPALVPTDIDAGTVQYNPI